MKFRIPLLFGLLLVAGIGAQAQCSHKNHQAHREASGASISRSDTIDILQYTLHLDVTDFAGQTISGVAEIDFEAKLPNVSTLSLDLLQLTIDDVLVSGSSATYNYNDTLLTIQLPTALNQSDQETVEVHYHGQPQQDASNWGGWYWNGNYAWNLGVGFAADPHNYGRVWHPCFDNFVERATYHMFVTTDSARTASCNGALVNVTDNGATKEYEWMLDQSIPTYLACVAVAPYVPVEWVHNAPSAPVDVQLWAVPNDTNNLKNSFQNLGEAIDVYENSYGPYVWNKVGYTLVPFNSGAMEHATNITYPRYAANGGLGNETLMAHELAHHWWGDLVTCRTAGDMWINEGMASYSEYLFLEYVYGWDEYIHSVEDDLLDMIRYAHVREEGHRAVSGVPHQYTYGDHVYTKGALMAHCMRGYMGDNLFFSGLTDFVTDNAFSDVSSQDMRDHLSANTGYDMTPFFDGWILNGGWTGFEIDSMLVGSSAADPVQVFISQKLTGAPALFTHVPMQITFRDDAWNSYSTDVVLGTNGATDQVSLSVPFVPTWAYLNGNKMITQAVTVDEEVIKTTGQLNLDHALITVNVGAVNTDSVLLRIEHHWAAADEVENTDVLKMQTSSKRWWNVQGIGIENLQASATVIYDGKTTTGNGGWLDEDLVAVTEDSLFLLWRPNQHTDWIVYPHYTKNMLGSSTNQFGVMELSQLQAGEYTLANQKWNVGLAEPDRGSLQLNVAPNPASGRVTFSASGPATGQLIITDNNGRVAARQMLLNQLSLDVSGFAPGLYHYSLQAGQEGTTSGTFVVQ